MTNQFFYHDQCPITDNRTTSQSNHQEVTTDTAQVSDVISTYNSGLRILHGSVSALSQRVLDYLSKAEFREPDAWLRDDYRIAWLTVLHCDEGIDQPWEYAFWRYLGKHSDKLIPEFVGRAERHAAMERKSPQADKPISKAAKAGP